MQKNKLHKDRKIGASDAPVIMGVSPWKTPYQLWLEKIEGAKEYTNKHIERGNTLEPKALDYFENQMSCVLERQVFLEDKKQHFMTATLDGYNEEERILLEVKCPKELHESVPSYYYPQLQHQLAVTGLQTIYYMSFDGEKGIILEVQRDQKYIDRLIEEERKFWDCVLNMTPPSLIEKDWVDMQQNQDWIEISDEYKKVKAILTELEEREKFLRSQFILFSEGKSAKGNGIKLTKISIEGRIDYKKIPELSSIDLNQYRKPSTINWRITEEN